MKIYIKPKNNLGRWAIWLIVIVPILFYTGMSFVSFYEFVPAGKTILQDVISRPGVALPMVLGFLSGIVAFICGLVDIIKKKDYSILVIFATIFGFLVLLWVLAQFLFP